MRGICGGQTGPSLLVSLGRVHVDVAAVRDHVDVARPETSHARGPGDAIGMHGVENLPGDRAETGDYNTV